MNHCDRCIWTKNCLKAWKFSFVIVQNIRIWEFWGMNTVILVIFKCIFQWISGFSSAISLWILRIFTSFVLHLSSCFHDSTLGLAMMVETRGNNFSLGQRQLLLQQRFAVLSTFLDGRLKLETQQMTRYIRYQTCTTHGRLHSWFHEGYPKYKSTVGLAKAT